MINGNLYREMIISASNALENSKEEINGLNIFPVPDGDTGTNMSLTMQAGKKELMSFFGNLSECSGKVAASLIRGGRGNSGVILSLFFNGFSKELNAKQEADTLTIAKALKSGVDATYKAVRHPTEGTVLTVMRLMAEKALEIAEEYAVTDDMEGFFAALIENAEETLANTPEMLPVLKQANVVDAGGKGFVVILHGMFSVISGNGVVKILAAQDIKQETKEAADFSFFDNKDIKFGYCTECIIEKAQNCTRRSVESLSSFINGIGDSVVFIDDDEIIKFHVHTNAPGKVLTEGLKCGSLSMVKIDNMRNQHSEISFDHDIVMKKAPEKRYGVVSVITGEGLCEVFKDLGVDSIVNGGQTMNPSTEDIVSAINITPSEIVFILPNNKNIYMAAKQAEELIDDKKVYVLKSMSAPQGISAMLAFNPDIEPEANFENMTDAMKSIKTAKITFAARDSNYQDSEIKEGQILGLLENDVKVVSDTKEACIEELAESFTDSSYITIFYGEDTDQENAEKMAEILKSKLGEEKEIMIINGGQPVYYYIISAE